jgi:DNA-binding response OmpR family regulator
MWDSGNGHSWYGDMGRAFSMLEIMDRAIVVLFVDDDASFAAVGGLFLETQGMRPIVVTSSMAALDAIDSNAIDVLVTDVQLLKGEPHGLALARMVRLKKPGVPVILMAVSPELLDGERLPGPLLIKPFDFAELSREIRASLPQP